MAPKPSYQLLIWSVPTVAFLLTCLWYRRKRSSLRSDPGGTASVDRTTLPLERRDSRREPFVAQSGSQSEIFPQVQADDLVASLTATDTKHKVDLTVGSCRNLEPDHLVTSAQEEGKYTSTKHTEIKDTSFFQEENPKLQYKVSPASRESVTVLETKVAFEKFEGINCKESEYQTESEETEFKENSIDNCNTSVEVTCGKETLESENKEETTSVQDIEKSGQVDFVNNKQLSEAISEHISDKIKVDILNVQQVKESVSVSKPSNRSVFNPDSVLSTQLAECNFSSASNGCVATDNSESNCVVEDSEHTVLQSPPCGECGVSDSVLTKLQCEAGNEKVPIASATNTGDLVDEASCSSVSVRTVMARKSSVDLAMEKSADSEGATAHGEHKLSISEQRNSSTENVPVERDSANHSPADVMLGSPAISNYSDANSEGSSDSGKGCSDMATPPPRTPASGSSLAGDVPSIYEFVLPQHFVGRLIGRYGAFVHQIKDKTNANILIKRHPDTTKLKICAIEGNQMGIERALEMIRDKFPLKKYPNVTLEQVCFVPAAPVFPVPQCVQLRLVEGVNNDVSVSYMVTPAHVFLQQPTHPTFLSLNAQAAYMQACYSEPAVPALPRPVTADVICVAPMMGDWCRAQVVTDEAEDGTCTIRLLDYGGYDIVDCSVLRQIRQDFMLLPFQAAEAYLANISPAGGEEEWSQEAFDVLEELTKGQVVEAQVVGYADNSVPIVYLYSIVRSKAIFINYELVKRGLAAWTDDCTVIMNGNGIAETVALTDECDRAVVAEK